MSRTARLAATVLTLMAAPASALAQQAPAQTVAAQPAPAPRPASAAERAAYDRLDPLARSVFWAREHDVNPADPVAGVRLAQALRELGNHDQAVQAAERTLAVRPDDVEALLELGRAHIARGQAFYGVQPLERAQAVAPGDWRPLSLLGVAYTQVRRHDDARAAWNTALRLSPDNPDVLANAAMAMAAGGDAAGAETLLRRAAAQPGARLQVRQNLAMVLGLQGKTAEAEAMLRRDLPPELAETNLDWLRQRAGTQAGTQPAAAPATARTWSSLQGG